MRKMDQYSQVYQQYENVTDIMNNDDDASEFNAMKIPQLVIASTGLITNTIVVLIFLNDQKMRGKIPNICIINQVCVFSPF